MNEDNLKLWTAHEDIDPRFTKAITGRDYGGTSPSPQYVIKCLTDLFGPVGIGFGWSVLAEGFERFGDTYLHWCRIQFHTPMDDVQHQWVNVLHVIRFAGFPIIHNGTGF